MLGRLRFVPMLCAFLCIHLLFLGKVALAVSTEGTQSSTTPPAAGEAEVAKPIAFKCGNTSTRGGSEAKLPGLQECVTKLREALSREKTPRDGKEVVKRIDGFNSEPLDKEVQSGLPADNECGELATVRCLNMALATVETVLRDRAATLVEVIRAEQKLANAPKGMGAANNASRASDAESHKNELKIIQSLVSVRPENLYENFEDYDDYLLQLGTGFEFVSLNKTFDKGLPRIGLLVNLNLGGGTINDKVHGFHLRRYGTRIGFAAALTSSAEQTPKPPGTDTPPASKDDAPAGGGTKDQDQDVKKTFAFGIQSYSPIFRTGPLHLRHDAQEEDTEGLRAVFGALVEIGGRKADEDTRVNFRQYGGLRVASNPEMYADVLYGRTQGLKSRRIEVRGQVPVMKVSAGDRIFLGAIGNFGFGRKAKDEPDVIRIYVSWNADLMSLFGVKNKATSK